MAYKKKKIDIHLIVYGKKNRALTKEGKLRYIKSDVCKKALIYRIIL